MPELGKLSGKQAAKLDDLAPISKQSPSRGLKVNPCRAVGDLFAVTLGVNFPQASAARQAIDAMAFEHP